MSQVTWLVEAGVFKATAPGITAALEARGVRWILYEDGIAESKLPAPGTCVVFWGSLGAAYAERVAARWLPGAFGDIQQFRCSVYVPRLRDALVNRDVVFTSVRDLVDRTAEILAPIGDLERVFVRPDSALKPFSGRVLERNALTRAALDYGFYYEDDALPVAVARVRDVRREWRCVVADGAVVAACEYSSSRQARDGSVPETVIHLASSVARHDWQPAPIYCVDVAEADDAMGVLELNPFSGADLYGCDPAPVIEAANRIAQRMHAAASDLHDR